MMAGLEPHKVTTHKYVFQNHTKLPHTRYDGWLRTTQSYHTQVCISGDMMAGLEPHKVTTQVCFSGDMMAGLELHKVTTHKYVFQVI